MSRGLVVDLFAGGGGASAGIEAALGRPVDIAINHDAIALAVHRANHPETLHLEADIWEVKPQEAVKGRPVELLWASPDCTHVWADVARMRTLNTMQAQRGEQQHLCPLPLDLVDRVIGHYSNPGDVVGDPFGGLLTVAERAIRLGRRAWSVELSPSYFADGVGYVKAAEADVLMPSLLDLMEVSAPPEASAEEVG